MSLFGGLHHGHYKLVGQTPVPCGDTFEDTLEWARWYETANEERSIARTRVGPCEVSTVFLGLDHGWGAGPPVLFETMVFRADRAEENARLKRNLENLRPWLGKPSEEKGELPELEEGPPLPAPFNDFLGECRRCSTWLQAEDMHKLIVGKLRAFSSDVEELWPQPLPAGVDEIRAIARERGRSEPESK